VFLPCLLLLPRAVPRGHTDAQLPARIYCPYSPICTLHFAPRHVYKQVGETEIKYVRAKKHSNGVGWNAGLAGGWRTKRNVREEG